MRPIIYILFLTCTLASADPKCTNGFEKLIENNLESFNDDFDPEMAREEFTDRHKRFGVFREKNRIVLVGRDAKIANQVVAELQSTSGTSKVAKPSSVKGVNGVAFDVTDIIEPLITELHHRYSFDGPNCWNLCNLNRGISKGLHQTNNLEFAHWLSSPLSQKIDSVDKLKRGDILAFRDSKDPVGETHGAVYLTPHVVFSKNGEEEMHPYRMMDLNEVYHMYKKMADGIHLFRVTPLPKYLDSHPELKTKELLTIMSEMEALEVKSTFFNMQDEPSMDTDKYQDDSRDFRKEKLSKKKELAGRAKTLLATQRGGSGEFILQGLLLRLQNPEY
jgi:hypothetical protein